LLTRYAHVSGHKDGVKNILLACGLGDPADLDVRVMVGVVADNRLRVSATFVERDRRRNTMTTDGFAQETQRRFTIPSGCQ
jgi:hypothetical protein